MRVESVSTGCLVLGYTQAVPLYPFFLKSVKQLDQNTRNQETNMNTTQIRTGRRSRFVHISVPLQDAVTAILERSDAHSDAPPPVSPQASGPRAPSGLTKGVLRNVDSIQDRR